MAGDDVDKKKPDPTIYRVAAERLKVDPKECLVVEDSMVGLKVGPKHIPSRHVVMHVPNAHCCWLSV